MSTKAVKTARFSMNPDDLYCGCIGPKLSVMDDDENRLCLDCICCGDPEDGYAITEDELEVLERFQETALELFIQDANAQLKSALAQLPDEPEAASASASSEVDDDSCSCASCLSYTQSKKEAAKS